MNTRERVEEVLRLDPYGELSDLAQAAHLGVSEATVSHHRRALGIPSAQARRRTEPGARVARCEPCDREYSPVRGRSTVTCCGCGESLRAEVVR